MNKYLKNLNRLEFAVTMACTGRCIHCSEGEHKSSGEHIDGAAAAKLVRELCGIAEITSVMTFGGEPLLYPEAVYMIHAAAKEAGVPKRQLITNGSFTKDEAKMKHTAERLAESGVNDLLLSADAFHQETIPLDTVKTFAEAVRAAGVPIRIQPAWLVSKDDENPYNAKTRLILAEFADAGFESGEGNVIFPQGNALKYLGEYFPDGHGVSNPYEEDPYDIRTVSVSPNGDFDLIGGNMYRDSIKDITESYTPRSE